MQLHSVMYTRNLSVFAILCQHILCSRLNHKNIRIDYALLHVIVEEPSKNWYSKPSCRQSFAKNNALCSILRTTPILRMETMVTVLLFADKMLVEGVLHSDVRSVAGLPVAYEDLMRLSIDYADAIVLASPTVNTRLYNYAFNSGKPILPYAEDNKEELMNFCNSLIPQE